MEKPAGLLRGAAMCQHSARARVCVFSANSPFRALRPTIELFENSFRHNSRTPVGDVGPGLFQTEQPELPWTQNRRSINVQRFHQI